MIQVWLTDYPGRISGLERKHRICCKSYAFLPQTYPATWLSLIRISILLEHDAFIIINPVTREIFLLPVKSSCFLWNLNEVLFLFRTHWKHRQHTHARIWRERLRSNTVRVTCFIKFDRKLVHCTFYKALNVNEILSKFVSLIFSVIPSQTEIYLIYSLVVVNNVINFAVAFLRSST